MGETNSCCCSADANRAHEKQLEHALRPTKRRKRKLFQEEQIFISQDLSPTNPDEDVKTIESTYSSQLSATPPQPEDEKQAELIRTKIDNRFSNITQNDCVQFLIDFKVIRSVYVPKDKYDRWRKSHVTLNRINKSQDLHLSISCDENKNNSDYKEMKCFLLKTFEKTYAINDDELSDFKRIILQAIELCPDIYVIDLNSSKADTMFLGELLNILMKRTEFGRYGPQIVDIGNLIKEEGLKLLCEYLEADIEDTKWLNIGHCFGNYDIPESIAKNIVQSFQKNQHILRMNITFNTKLYQHSRQIRKHVKNNENKFGQ